LTKFFIDRLKHIFYNSYKQIKEYDTVVKLLGVFLSKLTKRSK
jgi:hypothetical protein